MKIHNLALAVIFLVFSCSLVFAGTGEDQSQTSGGYPYDFYYNGHKWAKQEFVPTKEVLSKIELKLIVDYDIRDPCHGMYSSTEKIDIEIRDSRDDAVAYERGNTICGLSTGWERFDLTQTEDLEPGETYTIVAMYRGGALAPGYFSWDRSSSNRYSDGDSETHGEGTSSRDFTFKTYGESVCESHYFCEDGTVYHTMSDCDVYFVEDCPGECVDGACVSAPGPSLTISAFDVKDPGYHSEDSFDPGEEVMLYASVSSLNGVSGDYNIFFDVYKGASKVNMYSDEREAPRIGEGDNPHWSFVVPSYWSGEYRAVARIDSCGGTCSVSKTFTVGGSSPEPVPDYRILRIFTADSRGRLKTSFSPGEQAMLKLNIRNHGGPGDYEAYFDVLDDGDEVWSTSATGTLASWRTAQVVALFSIPNDWDGTYTFNGTVAPSALGADAWYSTPFTVHEVCTRGWVCVDETHRGYQMSDCSVRYPRLCTRGRVCSDGRCVLPTCSPADCGENADCAGSDCVCEEGFANVDDDWYTGCEVDLMDDAENCGEVGNACGDDEMCSDGMCLMSGVGDADYLILSRSVFIDFAEALISEGSVNEYFFKEMSEEEAEEYLSELVGMMKNLIPTEEELEEIGKTLEESHEMLNNVDDFFMMVDLDVAAINKANSILASKGLMFTSDTIPVIDGFMPDQTVVVGMYQGQYYTGKVGSGIHKAVNTYSDTVGRVGGAISIITLVANLYVGHEEYNGSWAHAIMYAGEQQLDLGLFVCQLTDWGNERLFEFVLGPGSVPPISYTEIYNVSIGWLIEDIVEDSHEGAESIDICWADGGFGELWECTARTIDLFAILLYPFPWIEEFTFISREGSPLTMTDYTFKNTNYQAGAAMLKLEVLTDKQIYTQEKVFTIRELSRTSGTLMQIIDRNEKVLNATLTTYTKCSGTTVDTCQYWVDTEAVVVSTPDPPEVDLSPEEIIVREGEPARFEVKVDFNGQRFGITGPMLPPPFSVEDDLETVENDCAAAELCRYFTLNTEEGDAGEYTLSFSATNRWNLVGQDWITLKVLPAGSPMLPELYYPDDGARQWTRFQMYLWYEAEGATGYTVKVRDSEGIQQYEVEADSATSCRWSRGGRMLCYVRAMETLSRGTYSWNIEGVDEDGIELESETRMFVV